MLRLKRPEGVLTHELAFRRIAESLNIGALDSENTSDPSRGAAAEKMTLSEGHTFTAIGDGEGGALKAAADDYYEHQDSSISERRMTIRNAEELVNFGRSQFGTTKRDFFSKKGHGMYRRYFHLIPTKGQGAVKRHSVQHAESNICEAGTTTAFKIRSIRRVACQGFRGLLWASERPCCDPNCPCMGGGSEGRHSFTACNRSPYTKCKQIQLEPLSGAAPTPTRGALASEGAALGASALVGDVLAVETESDETPFWLVEVTQVAQMPPLNYSTPDILGVQFEFPRLKQVIEVRRFRPATTGRGESSTRQFEYDASVGPFFIPCHLLRVGKIELRRYEMPAQRETRGSSQAPALIRHELRAEDKAHIYERCRILD